MDRVLSASEHKRSPLRCLSDVRQLPLLVGMLQVFWGFIPALNIDGSLFSRQLVYLRIGDVWGHLMILIGVYLVAGAVVNRRETLTVGLFLAAIAWTAMSVVFANAAYLNRSDLTWVTPVTLSMPCLAISCWFSLFRELLFAPVHLRDRRTGARNGSERIGSRG